MTYVISGGILGAVDRVWVPSNPYGNLSLYNHYNLDYAAIYASQPNVRTCVDFLARNIAQLGLHVFRRVSDVDRIRLTDHPLAELIKRPLPEKFKVTRYKLIESLVSDLGIYFNAYWLLVRGSGDSLGLLRVPPQYMRVYGGLVVEKYELNLGGMAKEIPVEDVIHFRGYNPQNPVVGLSPLETLRRVLAEEKAAGDYREYFWNNAARIRGILKRPLTAPDWSETARERFKAEFEELYTGTANSGKTAILEEDMDWIPTEFNAQESEYLEGRKLTREECARAFHIPLPLVGILDHATFSNIKEQHKNLYQDSLGPWLKWIEEDMELQLMGRFEDSDGVYLEFNIQEKLAGSFEEQTASLQSAVGRPWMTANEARARVNLPRLDGNAADEIVIPLNVLVGGQASPRDSGGKSLLRLAKRAGWIDFHNEGLRGNHETKWRQGLIRHYKRQEAAILARISGKGRKEDIGGVWWDSDRWVSELYADLLKLNLLTAEEFANFVVLLVGDEGAVRTETMIPWLEEHTRIVAEDINFKTQESVKEALQEDDPLESVKNVFVGAISVWAISQAVSMVTTAMNFGAVEAAKGSGLSLKMWQVNSNNPRDEHLGMDGEAVKIMERFSNGMKWPGDPAGGADNNANCLCSVVFK